MPATDVRLAKALADSATIAILQDQTTRESTRKAVQLQHALDSRVTIEQAKGMLAERSNVDMNEAFQRMRSYARANNRPLTAVALDIIAGTLPLKALSSRPSKSR
jgi:AmiR/NasT family two-component response regulator